VADEIRERLERLRPLVFPEVAAHNAFKNQLALADSQWLSPDDLQQLQLRRLQGLVRFAVRETGYWPSRINAGAVAAAGTLRDALDALPILPRADLRDHGTAMSPRNLPAGQVRAAEHSSSGSTGIPIHVTSTNLWWKWQEVLTLRTYVWAGVDFSRPLAVIRARPAGPASYPGPNQRPRWARRAVMPFATGPSFELDTKASLEQQWEWLARVRPSYLLTMPTIVRGLARCARKQPGENGTLRGILTTGEVVDPELRASAVEDLHAPLHDKYGSQEAGCMAIQCPDGDGYHVQSEVLILEVLREDGSPCRPGEIGRVVVTTFFNYGTVLLRYELGDYAELGEACSCGRGLPLLKRILGRRRNLLLTPDGRHYWPSLKHFDFSHIVPTRERQLRQVAPDRLEIWMAVDRPATPEQEEQMRKLAAAFLPARYQIAFNYVSEFPESAGGKHEEFVSLLSPTA
jgi:phenylacetate-CoA ligase